MHKLILGTLLVPVLTTPSFACILVEDPLSGEIFCEFGGVGGPITAQGAAAGAAPAVPCTGAGLPHGTEACNGTQTPIFDGGRTDALGVAAGVAGVGAAVTDNPALGVAAAALGLGAAVSNAADNGDFGGGMGGAGPSGTTTSTATGDTAF